MSQPNQWWIQKVYFCELDGNLREINVFLLLESLHNHKCCLVWSRRVDLFERALIIVYGQVLGKESLTVHQQWTLLQSFWIEEIKSTPDTGMQMKSSIHKILFIATVVAVVTLWSPEFLAVPDVWSQSMLALIAWCCHITTLFLVRHPTVTNSKLKIKELLHHSHFLS